MKEDIIFVINPTSGGNNKLAVSSLLQRLVNRNKFNPHIEFTSRRGHASEIACKALDLGVKNIVAVGGDGTINEIAQVLINQDANLGIIPQGSGNGLARHLKIPLGVKESIHVINQGNITKIDSAEMNAKHFFCTAGVGFDAYIGNVFKNSKTRGFKGYIRTCLKEFFSYKPSSYRLKFNDLEFTEEAFFITFANSAQYGNNAIIAPKANIKDGLLDICIMKPFPRYYITQLGIKLFCGTIDTCSYLSIHRTKELFLKRDQAGVVHLDGEPFEMDTDLYIKVNPKSLNVYV